MKITTAPAYATYTGSYLSGITLADGTAISVPITSTWAALPLASAYTGYARVTDVGTHGSMWYSDGSTWGIVGGSVVLWQSAVAGSALTGTTNETADVNFTLFGNLLGLNGGLEIQLKYTHTNDANTKTRRVRLGGTGITGTILADPQSSSNATTHVNSRIENRNSASSQLGQNGTVNYTASTNAWKTGAVDTTVDCLLAITTQLGNSGNSSTLEAYRIILIRP